MTSPSIRCGAQTVAGIECFFLAITRHREEAQKAQAEIDAVVGSGRLPSAVDRGHLPYCEALYLEIMRTYTFVPCGKLSISSISSIAVLMISSSLGDLVVSPRAAACST